MSLEIVLRFQSLVTVPVCALCLLLVVGDAGSCPHACHLQTQLPAIMNSSGALRPSKPSLYKGIRMLYHSNRKITNASCVHSLPQVRLASNSESLLPLPPKCRDRRHVLPGNTHPPAFGDRVFRVVLAVLELRDPSPSAP